MLHITPKEEGKTWEEIRSEAKHRPPTAIAVRVILFLAVTAFCLRYAYYDLMGPVEENRLLWNRIGVWASFLAVIEATLADYIKKFGFYETEDASVAYGFFITGGMLTSGLSQFANTSFLLANIVLALAVATLAAAANVIRRRFDFFDLGR